MVLADPIVLAGWIIGFVGGFLLLYWGAEWAIRTALGKLRRYQRAPSIEHDAALECPNCGTETGPTAHEVDPSQSYRCANCGKVFTGDDMF
ncbi:MAG: hypothetical protein ABEH77_07755 [Halobacteriaceae archaeon]